MRSIAAIPGDWTQPTSAGYLLDVRNSPCCSSETLAHKSLVAYFFAAASFRRALLSLRLIRFTCSAILGIARRMELFPAPAAPVTIMADLEQDHRVCHSSDAATIYTRSHKEEIVNDVE